MLLIRHIEIDIETLKHWIRDQYSFLRTLSVSSIQIHVSLIASKREDIFQKYKRSISVMLWFLWRTCSALFSAGISRREVTTRGNCAIVKLCSLAIIKLCIGTVVQLWGCAVVKLCSCEVVQLWSCAVVKLCSCKVVKLWSCAVVQLKYLTVKVEYSSVNLFMLQLMHHTDK